MTGQSTIHPFVLVDGHPDDMIETTAWVEHTEDRTPTPESAIEFLESVMPADDMLAEGESYMTTGVLVQMHEVGEDGRWEPTTDDDATTFWLVHVVCPT